MESRFRRPLARGVYAGASAGNLALEVFKGVKEPALFLDEGRALAHGQVVLFGEDIANGHADGGEFLFDAAKERFKGFGPGPRRPLRGRLQGRLQRRRMRRPLQGEPMRLRRGPLRGGFMQGQHKSRSTG